MFVRIGARQEDRGLQEPDDPRDEAPIGERNPEPEEARALREKLGFKFEPEDDM